MNPYPKAIVESIETLRMIEQAVTEDSMARKPPPDRHDVDKFVDAVRHRVSNAVAIFCATRTG